MLEDLYDQEVRKVADQIRRAGPDAVAAIESLFGETAGGRKQFARPHPADGSAVFPERTRAFGRMASTLGAIVRELEDDQIS